MNYVFFQAVVRCLVTFKFTVLLIGSEKIRVSCSKYCKSCTFHVPFIFQIFATLAPSL